MWARIQQLFGKPQSQLTAKQAHMTFAKTTFGRATMMTGRVLKEQVWIWPIVAIVLLATIGGTITWSIRRTMEDNLGSQLKTLLSVERAMLQKWLSGQGRNASTMANDQQIRQITAQILAAEELASQSTTTGAPVNDRPVDGPSLAELRVRLEKELGPAMVTHDYSDFVVVNKGHRVVAAGRSELLGQVLPAYASFLKRALDGSATVCAPFPSEVPLVSSTGRMETGVPTMFAAAPIHDDALQVVAVIALRIQPELEFTRIMQLGRVGESGETYAVDKEGWMVSGSRFDSDLVLLGLIPDRDGVNSILNIRICNPGGNMLQGFRPAERRGKLPLTRMAAAVVGGQDGVDVAGYPDYRGVPVVGAWSWLPDYELGVATEIDHEEAYRPLTVLQRTFYFLFFLLAVSAMAIFVFTMMVARAQREARKAAIEAKQLGQYRLLEKLGEGAMGQVYKGHHAMLRRPTAIKLLHNNQVNDTSIARFEREVQTTCQLNNPHTVAIYDYGRTPEGVFYYAMEYLDGIDLQMLVDKFGPQPEGRVVSILRQLCSSLYEAHSLGMVHRDIKPANIMLNRRGGEPDVVKLLDFGLVKALDNERKALSERGMAGTPHYMAPEAIQTPDLVDGRTDLYAVGAVAYFLLTGQPVFNASTLVELCQQHVEVAPVTPSNRLGRPVTGELEHAVLACLEKNRAKRPQTARDLMMMLDRVETRGSWSLEGAEAWWSRYERGNAPSNVSNDVIDSLFQRRGDRPAPDDTAADSSALNQTVDFSKFQRR